MLADRQPREDGKRAEGRDAAPAEGDTLVAPAPRRARADVTAEDVRAAYRLILGREPHPDESAAMPSRAAMTPDLATLRREFLGSDEFRAKLDGLGLAVTPPPPFAPLDAPLQEIEAEAPPEALARLLERLAACWTALGEEAPHWSVLPLPQHRPENLEAHREGFYQTGLFDLGLILSIFRRAGLATADLPVMLEYGCGVGRVTGQVAPWFREVIACDISQPHLDVAAARMEEAGIGNVRFHPVTAGNLVPSKAYDLFYSRLTLWHDPPPMVAAVLDEAFASLRNGGMAIFSVPGWAEGYRFSTEEYLAREPVTEREFHVFPQRAVFALANRHGCVPVELREDTGLLDLPTGRWTSFLYAFRKIGQKPRPQPRIRRG
ncbi:Methyltransferase [Roseomonas mucosa]|uniref:Biotin biosynthesis protein BioC n=1 Tax=Roseomonas mucosa TaxID=207340 RepID=A0A1S8D1V2_9PROT|nr:MULTISPECIES: class I SAM-dependent methyltransferase [Roseomonas]MBS5901696.1 class I SAM-dependent methyltransferase [Acetobacteraceae bacterium]AWV23508.1 Methyltransferase [Roseomonas mucosa]MCG7352157.1 class I SAM-dependent methyltransferase [Roseomonas mucosa]MCG7357493.1 class I SAM-dependent methyltransferase [Roseomonas mucosa]MDT8277011.1 class I SAM-dependent methyltransferase [Roseomonas mucosa]